MSDQRKALRQFRAHLEKKSLLPTTIKTYLQAIDNLASTANTLHITLLEALCKKASLQSRQWVTVQLAALRQFLSFARDHTQLESLEERTRSILGSTRPEKPQQDVTSEEVTDILKNLPHDSTGAITSIIIKCGLRVSVDALSIRRESLENAQVSGVLSIYTKGGKTRQVPSNVIEDEIDMLLREKWWYLYEVIATSERQAYDMIRKCMRTAARKAGVDVEKIHPHAFRHAAAEAVYEATGHDIVAVQTFLGHNSIVTTRKYLSGNKLETVGEALKKIWGK